jgi:hypothetical protein
VLSCRYTISTSIKRHEIILTWRRDYRDQQGGFPRVRPFHCTEVGLTPAIIPNADNSGRHIQRVRSWHQAADPELSSFLRLQASHRYLAQALMLTLTQTTSKYLKQAVILALIHTDYLCGTYVLCVTGVFLDLASKWALDCRLWTHCTGYGSRIRGPILEITGKYSFENIFP